MRLLDLFCGGGLAAWGYWRSGRFSEIVGVDKHAMPYPFDFVKGDAFSLDYDFLMDFDFIHASPPCQFYSKITPDRTKHPRLIPAVRLMLAAAGKQHVIENVEGSGHDLKPNWVMSGRDVGLPILRRRYFHCSWMRSCAAVKVSIEDVAHLSSARGSHVVVHGGNLTKQGLIEAMGLNEMSSSYLSHLTVRHIEQGIPPAMTKRIAEAFTPNKFLIGEFE